MLQVIDGSQQWYCSMCKRLRPDKKISTLTANSGNWEKNIKYCNDCIQCIERAIEEKDQLESESKYIWSSNGTA